MPKILPEDVSLRTAAREPQLAEQLVEVPTIVSWSLAAADYGARLVRFFRTCVRTRGRNCSPSRAHPCRQLMWITGSMATTSGSALTLCTCPSGRGCRQTAPAVATALTAARWLLGLWCGSSLVAERQEWFWLAGSWKNFFFYVACLAAPFALGNLDFAFALVSFTPSGVWVLAVEYVVFSGRVRCLVQQWIHFLRRL